MIRMLVCGWVMAGAIAPAFASSMTAAESAESAGEAPAATTQTSAPRERKILLIPVDDRPAVAQFAEMIGEIAGTQIETPPKSFLGKFKQPGSPESLLRWLRTKNLSDYDAVIVSTDMIAYGGLIASRVDRSSFNLASNRLRELWRIRKTSHKTPFYAFSSLMRIAPTAVVENRAWRSDLYYWSIWRERARLYGDPDAKRKAAVYADKIPAEEMERYDRARQRNVLVQRELVKMAFHGAFTHVVFGQDDAAPVGPHIREIAEIHQEVERLKVGPKVKFCMGIDQISNCLVTKVISDLVGWSPKVAIVSADSRGLDKIAAYETEPIRESLQDQIETSGATIVKDPKAADYTLFLNTPEPDQTEFNQFVRKLADDLGDGRAVAVADVNLGWTGTADPKLFDAITQSKKAPQMLSYAGWNTAGNTMGTTIPAANAYLLAMKMGSDPFRREVAARSFVLHRLVNDYFYNRYVRPEAYRMIEQMQSGNREEIYDEVNLARVEAYVKKDMNERLQAIFREQMVARPFRIGEREFHVVGLENVKIDLPWPRAYEVALDFNLVVREAVTSTTTGE